MVNSLVAKRVVGNKGPDRKVLPNWELLYYINNFPTIQKELLDIINKYKDVDDIGDTSKYPIATPGLVKLANMRPEGYRGIILQWADNPNEDNILDEQPYTNWNERAEEATEFKKFIQQCFPNAFRVRLACLPPGGELPWHIDTNTSVACRCQIPITHATSRKGATFEITRNGEHDYAEFPLGSVYFINAGFKHRVINNTNRDRWIVNFSVPFSDIEKRMKVNV